MQRRIGLAQALINDPDLVILDEPTSGLDPIGCREVKDLILALARRGKTVILSSHLLSDVEDVCDRVVIYYGGKIQAMGTLKELLATPDTLRITTPVLPRETMERVLEIIRQDVAADKVRMDNPTQNLESYFLDVVQKARQAAAETSGAQSGARVAAYLRGGCREPGRPTEKILEKLTLPQAAPAAPAAAAGGRSRAGRGREKTGGADQGRRTGRRRRPNPRRRRRPSRRICPRRTKNCRRCWANRSHEFTKTIELMQRILAIAWLTWKAALRFRLFLVIAVLLLAAVVGLPLLIKDDGTARGFTQILLTYTLSAITALARPFDALAVVRHAGARHRGMPDAGRRDQADRALADLAGQMAGHRVAERGVAGDFRRVRLRLAAMARDEAAGGGADNFARAGAGGARLGQGTAIYDAEIEAETERMLQERLKKQPGGHGGPAGGAPADPRAGQGGLPTRAAGLYRAVAD